MSRIRQEISSVQFQIDSRKANASMDALQAKARDLNKSIKDTEASIKALGDVAPDDKKLLEYQQTLRQLNRDLKDVASAQRDLIKGVKAADKLWDAARTGTIENLSVRGIKAGQRGLQQRMQSLQPGDKADAEVLRAYKAVIEEADITMLKFQTDAANTLKILEDGGSVSVQTMRETRDRLKELVDITPTATAEYKEFKSQLDQMEARMSSLTETERRLAGEIVTVADAMKMANASTREAAEARIQQAETELKDAQKAKKTAVEAAEATTQRVEAAEKGLPVVEKDIEKQKELIAAIHKLTDEQEKAEAAVTKAETARQKKVEELGQLGEAAYQAQKKVIDLQHELKVLQTDPVGKHPVFLAAQQKVIDADYAQIGESKELNRLKGLQSDAMVRTGFVSPDELNRQLETAQNRISQEKAELEQILELIKKIGISEADITKERESQNKLSVERESQLREAEDAYAKADVRRRSIKEFEAQIDKIKEQIAATEELSQLDQQVAAQEQKLAEAKKLFVEAQEQEKKTKQELIKEMQESGELERREVELKEQIAKAETDAAIAKEKAKDPTEKLAKAEADVAEAQKKEAEATANLNKALNGSSLEQHKEELNALEVKHQELTETINKEKDAIAGLEAEAAAAAQKETEAAIEMAQAQNYSQKSLEDSIALLEKQSKMETDPKKYQEMTTAIETMQQRVKEMTGEWMSYAEAEKFAQGIGTDGFIATSDQLQKATQSLYRYRDALIKTIQQKRDDGKATAEEEAELKKVETELKKMKFEMDNANMSSKRMHEILKDPKSAKNIEELSAAIKRSTQELKLMEETIGKDNAQYKEMAEQTKKATIEQKNMEAQFKASASAFDKAWSRLKTYVGLYVGAAVAMQKITATMGDLMELSDKMGEVRKTTGFTADEVGRLSDNLKKLDVRTSLTSLMELSSLAGSVGLKTQEDVQGFTEAANQLMIALPEMGNESARTLIKIAQATGDLQKNNNDVRETLEKVGSTIIALRANSASAAGPITDFVSRVGAVGAQAGISIDQIAALGSTIDALGGRVEMSATALSRMIPAIRNNAFGVANAIGVTEKTLTDLFNQGKAMEAMVLIFEKMRESVKQFDTTTEEGQEAMAKNVEELLGKNAAMADVMKELNQQGARAGIVFGLLSQNVDELKEQLGIAGEAYRDNIALQEEFNKMNDTTAAKWERLKNQLEEMFVSDSAQRGLGWIIDKLRDIVDLLSGSSGLSVAIRSILIYLALVKVQLVSIAAGALKSLLSGLKSIGVMLGFIKGEMTALQWGNIFTAAAAAIWLAVEALGTFRHKAAEAFKEAGKWAQKIVDAEQAVESNFKAVEKANGGLDEANKKLKEAKTALEKAKKAMDGSKESADRLKKAEEDLSKAEQDVAKAEDSHRAAIDNINKIYGKYLGFTLSEVSSKKELAAAQELVNSKLREELTLKQRSAALSRVEDEMGGERDQAFGAMSQALGNVFRKKVQVKRGKGQEQTGWANDTQRNAELLRQMTKMAQEQKLSAEQIEKALSEAGVSIYETSAGSKKRISAYGASLRNVILNYSKEFHEVKEKVAEVETQFDVELSIDREKQQENLQRQYQQSEKTYAQLEQKHAKAKGDAKKKAAADLLKQADTLQDMIKNAGNFYKLDNKAEKQAYDKFISDTQKRIDGIEEQREALLKEAGELYKPQAGSSSSINTKSDKPYGTFNRVTDPYEKWDADSLVARRKEMLERVRALANGADVQKVLSEDAKFITEATRKNIKTTKDAIEWYNQERLKIQEALHARYLTNTGDWMDPKKGGKKASKMVQDEMKYYLDELDAYYTERKTMIQEARNDEQISEGEAWRRTLQNEAEWQQRRAELQQLYAKKSAKVTQEEQNAIFEILSERTDDRVEYIKQDIENTVKFIEKIGKEKGKPAMDRIIGDIDLGIEKAFLKQRTAVSKQMDAIADIVNKERPYNGITENLQENLTKMGILQADFEKQRLALLANRQDTSELDEKYAAEIPQRLSFLLNEAESAYTLTVEELMKRLADNGMQAWADELSKNPTMQQALLAHLRLTYDKIQDAIKKEASLIKKEVDIWWADIAPGADQSRKDGFERILSQLGQLSDSMSHANQLIGAGAWSERVADKLAIKQMEVRLAMQTAYYNKMRQIGEQEIQRLKEAGREEDAEHLQKSLNLAITQEQVKLDEQRVAIANRLEESQNRLYTSLKEWSELIASSIQGVFEASNTGLGEFYTEQAKKRLTGAATSGTYIVVNDAGTKKAEASYETLTDEEVLKIEQRNAQADAWKKMMDDLNMKMSDMITDQINAFLQNASIDANTDALGANTEALLSLTSAMTGGSSTSPAATAAVPTVPDTTTETVVQGAQKRVEATVEANKKITASTQSAFAKMTQAANLYGIAYQAMSNDNMNAAQKFGMIALQTAGNMAMAALTADWSKNSAEVAGSLPAILAKCLKISPIWGSVIFAGLTGLLGGAMGVAAGKIAKSKSEIAQATGAGVQAGRLATGMLTYAEGNVNEFSDPSSLTPGRQYNVDGADGRTYRARYMGKDAKTHITNGPEFHLVGEKGREAIIDAKTTRQIQMNDPEIWRSIQVLYNGGSLSHTGRRGRGVRTFAAGNIDEFDTVLDGSSTGGMDMAAMQASLDRNSAATEALVAELAKGIKSTVSPYGKDGIVHGYDRGKAEAKRHGLSYIP